MNNVQNYYKELNSYKIGNPLFIDPLYVPYHKNREIAPINPYKINTGYPLVDPYKRFLGKGLAFRSQYRGICPLGYKNVGDRNMCVPVEEENDQYDIVNRVEINNNVKVNDLPPVSGTFYSNISAPNRAPGCTWNYSYGNTQSSPMTYASTPYNSSMSNCSIGCSVGNIRGANSKNDKDRLDMANCITENFW